MRGLLVLFAASFATTWWWSREGPAAPDVSRSGTVVRAPSLPEPVATAPVMNDAAEIDSAVTADPVSETQLDAFEPVIDAALMAEDPAERQAAIRTLADAPAGLAVSALVEVLRVSDDESDLAAARWALQRHDRSESQRDLDVSTW